MRTPKARTQSLRRLGWLPTGPAVFLPSGTRKTLECGACQERVCTLTVRCPEASSVSFPSISPLGWAPAPCPAISWLLYLPLCSPHLALPCSHGCPDLPPTPHSFLLKPTFLLEGGGLLLQSRESTLPALSGTGLWSSGWEPRETDRWTRGHLWPHPSFHRRFGKPTFVPLEPLCVW